MAKHCRSSSSNIVPYLPEEILLTEIFPRLPVRGVGKCRCLSKEWYAKLSTSEFISMHLNRKIYRQENTLLLETREQAIHCTMPSRTRNNRFLSRRIDLRFTYEGFQIENTCHGLVLLQNERSGELLLVNPVTRKQLTIPKPPLASSNWINCPALGYDSSAMDYKIAYLDGGNEPPFVHVYSVKIGIWKRYDFPIYGAILCSHPKPGKVVLNGIIHWLLLVQIPPTITTEPPEVKYVMCSFDLAREVFGDIPRPGSEGHMFMPQVLGECLSVILTRYDRDSAITDLWLMKEYGVFKSWAKLASWQLEKKYGYYRYEPVCLNGGDEEILMRTHTGELVMFNIKQQNAIDVFFEGSKNPFHFGAGHIFMESLVSSMPTAIAN